MRAAALLGAAALALAVFIACDDEARKPPFLPETSPTPTETTAASPTPLPTPSPTGPAAGSMEDFRAFAALIDAALTQEDASFFSDRGVEIEVTCRGDEQLGFCMGQPLGAVFRGIPGTAWQSDAFALHSPADYDTLLGDWFAEALPQQSDEFGDGAVKLFAVAQVAEGDGEFLAIATAILNTGPATEVQRQARIFRFAFGNGSWSLRGEILAAVSHTAGDWLTGDCEQCYDRWERWEGPA